MNLYVLRKKILMNVWSYCTTSSFSPDITEQEAADLQQMMKDYKW